MAAQPMPNFCGSFYTMRWPIAACDQAINIYQETRQLPGSPKNVWVFGTPALKLETTLATSPCRGWFSQDGRTFTVYGSTLYERTAAATFTAITGTIPDDGFPVSFASNGLAGDQLAIVGGGTLSVYDLVAGGALTAVSLPFDHPVMIVFQDGYGLINQRDTPTVWFTALEDFTSIDALDFFTRSTTSDNVVGLAVSRDRIFVIGSKTTDLYYDSGNADNPWLPYPGTSTQIGCVAWPTIKTYSDVVRWVGRSTQGQYRVVESRSDMNVRSISTPPIDDILAACTTLTDLEALMYEQSGHAFYLLTAPSSPDAVQTYGYDVLESQLREAPVWHARAGLTTSTGQYTRWRARGSTADGQVVLAGDYATGAVYTLDLSTYADNGVTLKRERVAPYLSTGNQWLFGNAAELLTQPGEGLQTGQGSTPQVELLISRDGTRTWISRGFAALGVMGAYLQRTFWTRLGRVREDRFVVRVIQTDRVQCVWTGLALDVEKGTGQLT